MERRLNTDILLRFDRDGRLGGEYLSLEPICPHGAALGL